MVRRMRRMMRTTGVRCVVAVASTACGSDEAASPNINTVAGETTATTAVSTSLREPTPPTLNFDGVPAASIPMVISEHLNEVQTSVRADVGDDVFAGAAFTNDANDTMSIYGTDADVVTAALNRVQTPLRQQITVIETRCSVNDLEIYADEAQTLLDKAGIKASTWVQFGVDAVVVQIETPDGQPNEALGAEAIEALPNIPISIGYSGPFLQL